MTNTQKLAEEIVLLLTRHRETLAVAESCTGGYIANLLTDIPGASVWFERGAVCYSNQSKIDWLGFTSDPCPPLAGATSDRISSNQQPATSNPLSYIIGTYGAVSRECAEAMAVGIRQVAGTNYGMSVTGIAGPTGGTPEKPVGTVFIGLACPGGVTVAEHHFPGDRLYFKKLVAAQALLVLKAHLYAH